MENKPLDIIQNAIENKLGSDIVVLNMNAMNPFVDYYVICSARNEANARAIYREIEEEMGKNGYDIRLKDDGKGSGWYLIETGEVLTHIFFDGKREYYNLEELWKDLRISGK